MSQVVNAIKMSDAIPNSSTFTSQEFDASAYSKARIDCHITAKGTNSIRFKVQVAAKQGGDYTDLKSTGALSATGHTTILLNSNTTAAEVFGWFRIVADTATDSGTGFSAIVDVLLM